MFRQDRLRVMRLKQVRFRYPNLLRLRLVGTNGWRLKGNQSVKVELICLQFIEFSWAHAKFGFEAGAEILRVVETN